MFETAQVGDKVYHYKYGWTVITQIMKESSYPIIMDYDFSFTYEGFADKNDKNPSLFWDEVIITPPSKPLPKLEKDTKVLVWNEKGVYNQFKRYKRYFTEFNTEGLIRTFSNGATSFSTDKFIETWQNRELYEENE